MKFFIFGLNFFFESAIPEATEVLKKELNSYPKSISEKPDVNVKIVERIEIGDFYFRNPSLHITFKNGFVCDYGSCKVSFELMSNKELNVQLELNKSNFLRKFWSMGFESTLECLGQLLHELILVPATFFVENLVPVHAAAFDFDGRGFVVGGTGGVGKTSIELLACQKLGGRFWADDIAVLHSDGQLYANLSYPKIYGYNIENNSVLKQIICHNRGLLDKLHWYFHMMLRGASKVRRRVDPNWIFEKVGSQQVKLDSYSILSRRNDANCIRINLIDNLKSAVLSTLVMVNEYNVFLKHIIWHEYNCAFAGWLPIIRLENLLEKLRNNYVKAFQNAKCFEIVIPIQMKHNEYLSEMTKYLESIADA